MSFKKNSAVTGFTFGLVSSTNGSDITTGTPVGYYTLDGGTQTAIGDVTPVHEGNGQWSFDLLAAEMNGDIVGLTFTHTSAITAHFTIKTDTKIVSELNDFNSVTDTVGTVTTLTNLPAITTNWLTATGIASSAMNGKGDWNIGKTGYTLTQSFPANFASTVINGAGAVDGLVQGFLNNLLTETTAGRITANFDTFFENADAVTAKVVDDVGAGGGGGTDWTASERNEIRGRLGVTGTTAAGGNTPTLSTFNPVSDTVANVTTVATTTTNTDMRGTDGANTTAPDNTSITAILVDTNDLQTNQGNWLTATGFALSSVATEARLSELDAGTGGKMANQVDLIKTDTSGIDDLAINKNAAFPNFEFLMVLTSDGRTPATGLTVTAQASIDGASFINVSGSITEVSNGIYQFDALAADTNGDVITWRFSSATADDTFITFKTVA